MSISVSRGGSLAAASDRVVLSVEGKLFEADSSGRDSTKPSATLHGGESFGFSFYFPTYIANGRDPLPPSQSLSQQGAYCTVNYAVRVDVIRKGLRRHERYVFPSAFVCAQGAWCSLPRVSINYQDYDTNHVPAPFDPT